MSHIGAGAVGDASFKYSLVVRVARISTLEREHEHAQY